MFEFILAVLFVELTPGPNMAYLAALALARGRTAGLFAIISELENYCSYIHGSMKSFAGLVWPTYYSLLGKVGKRMRDRWEPPI
jgi:hypothetical protein